MPCPGGARAGIAARRRSDEVGQPLPPLRGRGQPPELLGHPALQARREGVVALERRDLRRVAPDGPALALPRPVRGERWRASATGASAAAWRPARPAAPGCACSRGPRSRTTPGRAAPRAPRSEASCTITWSGLPSPMGKNTAVGSSSAMVAPSTGATSSGRGRSSGSQVLVVGEVEPGVVRLEHGHRGHVLLAAHRHDVVAGHEPAQGVPLRGFVGIGRWPAAQHRDHRGVVVAGEQVARPHGGVVEMRGDDDDAGERARIDLAPGRLREGVAHDRIIRARRRPRRPR